MKKCIDDAMTFTSAWILAGLLLLCLASTAFAQSTFRINSDTAGTGFPSNIRNAPTYTDAKVLVAGVSQTESVPTGSLWVVFSSTCNFYAKTGAAAAVPGASVTDGTASALNPAAWFIPGVTQITVIAGSACVVTMDFYK